MSKTWEIEITTLHDVEAETEDEAIDKCDKNNITKFVRIEVISRPLEGEEE